MERGWVLTTKRHWLGKPSHVGIESALAGFLQDASGGARLASSNNACNYGHKRKKTKHG